MSSNEYSRKMRIACQAFNIHRLLWQRLRYLDAVSLYKYLSHKLLRWLSMYTLSLGMTCFVGGLLLGRRPFLAFFLVALSTITLDLGRRRRLGFASRVWGVFSALVATAVGVWLSVRGERFQIWTPSARIEK